MPGLSIKDVPAPVHRKLKRLASHHRRSMTQEALVLLEEALAAAEPAGAWPAPYRGSIPLTPALLRKARRARV